MAEEIKVRLNLNRNLPLKRQDLTDMKAFTVGNLRQAIENAEGRLEDIIRLNPQRFEVVPDLSSLGSYLVVDEMKRAVDPFLSQKRGKKR